MIEISMGIAGVGLPETDYMLVAKKLYGLNSKIICPSTYGSYCHSDLYCAQLLPTLEEYNFSIEFGEKK